MSGEAWRKPAAETLRAIGSGMEAMADALDEDDGILGALAGMNLSENLPALPKHIRDTFMEYLCDEAAAGLRSERLYIEAQMVAERTPEAERRLQDPDSPVRFRSQVKDSST